MPKDKTKKRGPKKERLVNGQTPPWRTDPLRNGKPMNKEEAKMARRLFLIELKKCGVVSVAARRVGILPSQITVWKGKFPKFADKIDQVLDEFYDELEAIAIDRAKLKSDTLMQMLLRANRPHKYSERMRMEAELHHQGANAGSPVQIVFSRDEVGEADGQNTP